MHSEYRASLANPAIPERKGCRSKVRESQLKGCLEPAAGGRSTRFFSDSSNSTCFPASEYYLHSFAAPGRSVPFPASVPKARPFGKPGHQNAGARSLLCLICMAHRIHGQRTEMEFPLRRRTYCLRRSKNLVNTDCAGLDESRKRIRRTRFRKKNGQTEIGVKRHCCPRTKTSDQIAGRRRGRMWTGM